VCACVWCGVVRGGDDVCVEELCVRSLANEVFYLHNGACKLANWAICTVCGVCHRTWPLTGECAKWLMSLCCV